MWRKIVKEAASSKKLNFLSPISSTFHQNSKFLEKLTPAHVLKSHIYPNPYRGFNRLSPQAQKSTPLITTLFVRGHASAAEPIASSEQDTEDLSGSEQVQELMLKKRQIKAETDAWDQAAKEYKELLTDMREEKLASNLPYVKSLFLGWFQPLRDAIAKEQAYCEEKKHHKPNHAEFISQLSADKMAVIVMHKMMGLMMTDAGGVGNARVIQAASKIGLAIENEARIHKFLAKFKKKNKVTDNKPEENSDTVAKDQGTLDQEQGKLRKKVTVLIKKQKLRLVNHIVKKQDDSEPWGEEGHVKV